MSEFDGIVDHDGWRGKLKTLLQAAEVASRDDDVAKRSVVAERLTQFIEHSFPNDEVIRSLDKVASQAAKGLLRQTIDERIRSIVSSNAELATLAKQFEAAAGEAAEAAARIRLDRASRAIEAINGGIAALKELKSSLKAGDDDELVASIQGVLSSALALRARLEA